MACQPFGHPPGREIVELLRLHEIVAPLEEHEFRQQGRRDEELHRQRVVDVARLGGFSAVDLPDFFEVAVDHVAEGVHRAEPHGRRQHERKPLYLPVPVEQAVERYVQRLRQDARFPDGEIDFSGHPPVDRLFLQFQDVRYLVDKVCPPGHLPA